MIELLASLALIAIDPYARFDWQPPLEGPTPHHYEVLVEQVGAEPQTFITTQPSLAFVPIFGSDITISVSACQSGSCGPWSEPSDPISINRSADFTGDGIVGVPDFISLSNQYGQPNEQDLSGDGIIGFIDVILFNKRFGQCVGETPIAEGPAGPITVESYVVCGEGS